MPLLDTSHLIGLLRKDSDSISIQINLDEKGAYQYISAITVFELTAGAYRSSNPGEKLDEIDTIIEHIEVISVSRSLAEIYAVLVNKMRSEGIRIGALDEILAATALDLDAKIITRDGHFLKCPGIEVTCY